MNAIRKSTISVSVPVSMTAKSSLLVLAIEDYKLGRKSRAIGSSYVNRAMALSPNDLNLELLAVQTWHRNLSPEQCFNLSLDKGNRDSTGKVRIYSPGELWALWIANFRELLSRKGKVLSAPRFDGKGSAKEFKLSDKPVPVPMPNPDAGNDKGSTDSNGNAKPAPAPVSKGKGKGKGNTAPTDTAPTDTAPGTGKRAPNLADNPETRLETANTAGAIAAAALHRAAGCGISATDLIRAILAKVDPKVAAQFVKAA